MIDTKRVFCWPALLLCIGVAPAPRAAAQLSATTTPRTPTANVPAIPAIWRSPELNLGEGKTIESALNEPFEEPYEVTLSVSLKSARKTLRNCLDYLPVERSISDAGPAVVANVLHYQGARCDALDLLRSARPAERPAFRDFSFKHLAATDLPPGLAPIPVPEERKEAERIDKRGGSIVDLEKKVILRPKGPYESELVTPDWTARLTVLAHADFLGDGNEELLIRRNAAVIGGSMRSTTIFLLSRPRPGGRLSIVGTRP